jgi:hypothetical protein
MASAQQQEEEEHEVVEDLFDALLHLEDRLLEDGRHNGRLNAHKAAFDDGRQLGLSKGAEVGHELGFYYGHLLLWWCHLHPSPPPPAAGGDASPPSAGLGAEASLQHSTGDACPPNRAVDALAKLRELVDSFPNDPTKEDLFEQLDRIRGKYRQLTSLLKAPPTSRYRGPSTASPSPAGDRLTLSSPTVSLTF